MEDLKDKGNVSKHQICTQHRFQSGSPSGEFHQANI